MTPFFRREEPIPHEPSAAERAGEPRERYSQFTAREVVAVIDGILDGQKAVHPQDRNVELIDVLLDVRNLLAVPVIPGRPS